jgi:uncharacterized protein (TIGR03067 family)
MARNELDLDGWWIAIDGELGGIPLPTEALSDLPLRLQKGRFRLGSDEGRTVFNGHARPTSLDLILTRGPNRGRIVPAIYDLSAGGLRLCCDLSGGCRPDAFTSPSGTRRFLVSYRRT